MSPRSVLVRDSDFEVVYRQLPRHGLLQQIMFEQNLARLQNQHHHNLHNRVLKGIFIRVFLLGLYIGSACGFLVGFPYWKLKQSLWSWTLFKWQSLTTASFLAPNLNSTSASTTTTDSSNTCSSVNWTLVDCEKSGSVNCQLLSVICPPPLGEEPSIFGLMDILIFITLFLYPIYYIYKIICELINIFKSYTRYQEQDQ